MQSVRFVGLDVHQGSITIAVADSDKEPVVVATIPNDIPTLVRRLKQLAASGDLRCCYEAGGCGFVLARKLRKAGIACEVIAPSLVPVQPGKPIKTDRRDARRLARFLRSGDLVPIHIPDEQTEAMRDLSRAREDAKQDQTRARNRLSRFLVRHDHRFSGTHAWTRAHWAWVLEREQHFAHPAQRRALRDYIDAVKAATDRVTQLDRAIAELAPAWAAWPLVQALMAFRGIDLHSAVVLTSEVGDFRRFAKAGQFMSFVGLVPGEDSTGMSIRRKRITKAGNAHVRHVLVQAALNYGPRPSEKGRLQKRSEGAPVAVKQIAWKAQRRLHQKLWRLRAKGKTGAAAVAVARELAGFVWAAGRQVQAEAKG